MPETAFDRATAVAALGGGAWRAHSSPEWSAPRGPNGGYLAAIVVRAMQAELADPQRPARSITLHYLRPPGPGELRVDVVVERTGRRLSTLGARVVQDGRLCVIAIGAFSGGYEPLAEYSAAMPEVPSWEEVEPLDPHPQAPPISHRVEQRPVIGAQPFSGAAEALSGGWMRLHEPHPMDAPALALYADAWLPSLFPRLHAPIGAPTIDLTIHFRAPAAAAAVDPASPVLGVFRSEYAADGLFEEDGELWAADGRLLAHSRQLALLVSPAGARS